MKSISKSEMDFLIEQGVIKCIHGRYQGLITGGKHSYKPRWVEPPIYEQLLKLQKKLKVEQVEQ